MYSAKMREMTAFPPASSVSKEASLRRRQEDGPGLRAEMAVHANRYETSGPYAYWRYACAPPLTGIDDPSSAKLLAPVHARRPAASHTTRLAPTLWVFAMTTPGDELAECQLTIRWI